MRVPASRASVAGRGHELVGHQVVTDERHPAVDPGWPAARSSTNALAVEHLVDRPGERRPSATSQPHEPSVPPTPTRRSAASTRSGWATVPASTVNVIPLVTASTSAERRRQLVVVAGVGGVDRHRPLEDRVPGIDVVGDRRAHQPVAGEVLVGVDRARASRGGPARRARSASGARGGQLGGRSDGDDAVAVDEHAAVGDHPAVGSIVSDDVPEHEQHRANRYDRLTKRDRTRRR